MEAEAYSVPTDAPESDGTLEWNSTGLVVAHARSADETGLGFAYTSPAAAEVVRAELADVVVGRDALSPPAAWEAMRHAVRNVGRPGLASSAIAAVDVALWDLEARLLGLPLARLWGPLRDSIPAYGSGGFTSYGLDRLRRQLSGWVEAGMTRVKMKVGRDPRADPERVAAAREAIGPDAALFVDANGAYSRKDALAWTWRFYDAWDIAWMEEPVSSDDLDGLRLIRDQGPPGVQIAAGEYGWDLFDFRELLARGAVDTLQADVGRCGGYTAFRRVAALCEAHQVPLSSHTAPALHAPVMCAAPRAVHAEYFHDHARIEALLFDGGATLRDGQLEPSPEPGHGLRLKRADARSLRVA